MSGKLLLVDGHSLFHRAYHALPPLTASNGQPTNALYGFLQMMLGLLDEEQPDYAAVAIDLPGPTFREEIFEQYKANRPPMEDDLVRQVELLHEVVEALGMREVGVPGFEADDVIGTLAQVGLQSGCKVLVVTGDKDLLQLVRPGVEVIVTVKGIRDTQRFDEVAVREKMGLDPAQIVDLKALSGDSSDNIPGVKGIGDKGALALLQQYGSVEAAIAAGEQVQPARLARLLQEGREQALLSKRLATIRQDVPMPGELEQYRWQGLRADRLRELATRLEFASLLNRLPALAADGKQVRAQVAEEAEAVSRLARDIRAAEAVSLGLVTGAGGELVLGVAPEPGDVRVVTLSGGSGVENTLFGVQAKAAPNLEPLAEVLADPTVAKAGADLKGMIRALRGLGLSLEGIRFAPEIASYLLMPNRRYHSIDLLAQEQLRTGLPDGTSVTAGELSPVQTRAAAMAEAVRALQPMLRPQLQAADLERLFDELEMPLVAVLADMEEAGIAVDVARLAEIGRELEAGMAQVQAEVYALAGREFNIGSPKQLGEVLFGELGLPRGRRTSTGWSTSAEVLEELANEHEVVAKVLQWREYAKLKSTYVDGLAREVNAATGRVHTTFEQTVTATGRLSSRNPNLQNIPVRTEWGRKIRGCFVAGGKDQVLLAADYSQIELRVLAHVTGDPRLVEAFRAGEDIHATTAAALFDVPVAEVTAEMRSRAKTVNFAVLYGQGPVALARQLGIPREQAAAFIESYFARMPRVREWIERTVAAAREQLFVTTLLGRKRPLPDIVSANGQASSYAERAAINTPIQGSAADIIKLAMIRLAPQLAASGSGAQMLLQVHDELVLEAPAAAASSVGAMVKRTMEEAYELDVPLMVEVKVGRNWLEMEELQTT